MSSKSAAIRLSFLCTVFLAAASFILQSCEEREGRKAPRSGPAELVILYSSDLLGNIRSCGCAEKDMGGLGRWATYVESSRRGVDNLIFLNAGDLFSSKLSFSQREAELTLEALSLMGLDALTPGELDLLFGLRFLRETGRRSGLDILAANLIDAETGETAFGIPYKIIELERGFRVGVTGILDETATFPSYIDTSKFELIPADRALSRIIPKLKSETDYLVLLSHLGSKKSRELAKKLQDFDLIVVGHGKPVVKKIEKEGKTVLVGAGGGGQYLGRLRLSISGSGEHEAVAIKLVPILEEINLHPGVKDLFDQYGVNLTEKEEHAR